MELTGGTPPDLGHLSLGNREAINRTTTSFVGAVRAKTGLNADRDRAAVL
jgi:hypothetical protein